MGDLSILFIECCHSMSQLQTLLSTFGFPCSPFRKSGKQSIGSSLSWKSKINPSTSSFVSIHICSSKRRFGLSDTHLGFDHKYPGIRAAGNNLNQFCLYRIRRESKHPLKDLARHFCSMLMPCIGKSQIIPSLLNSVWIDVFSRVFTDGDQRKIVCIGTDPVCFHQDSGQQQPGVQAQIWYLTATDPAYPADCFHNFLPGILPEFLLLEGSIHSHRVLADCFFRLLNGLPCKGILRSSMMSAQDRCKCF